VRIPLLSVVLAAALCGCTAGAPGSGSSGGSATTSNATTTSIAISLTASVVTSTPYGSSGGFMPAVTTVKAGTYVVFVNKDSFAHTSTSMSATSFPAASPFGSSALTASGTTLSGGWSTGALAPNNASQKLLADKPGTYLYGCFFHYGAPMRGAIVVR